MLDTAHQPLRPLLDRISKRLVKHRLNRNLTQEELAEAAGISRRTLARLENGEPTQLENFLRTLIALGLDEGLDKLVPDVPDSPIQQLDRAGRSRKRASGKRKQRADSGGGPWSWGDES
jgi:transcriptional regulator with XRE-family HTH domain